MERVAGNAAPTAASVGVRASPYHVQVLDRTLRILDILAAANQELALGELAERLSLHKSTTHRLMMILLRQRLVRKGPDAKYGLGMKLFELGSRAVARLDLRERSEPVLRRLADTTDETAHVCVLDGSEVLSIANVEGRWRVRTPSTVGRRTPPYCTAVGKAILAFLPDGAVADILAKVSFRQYTPNTLTSRAALNAELQRARRRGFAIDDEEIESGLRCVGAPIRNYKGHVIAAISVAGPVFRLTKQRLPKIARAVMAAGRDLSRDVGYEG